MATKNKAAYSKQWRKTRKEKHRLEIFAMEYLQHKYPEIRVEIEELFQKINTKYPKKSKLSITPEFGVWKTNVKSARQSYQETPVVTTAAVTACQETSAVTTTAVMSASSQETPAVTTTTVIASSGQESALSVIASSGQESALCDLELGASTIVDNEDPWLDSLNDAEMQKIIEDLHNDPDLRPIMDAFEQYA